MKVYISSSFSARESGADDLLQLRQDLGKRAERRGVTAVLGEEDEQIKAAAGDDLRIMERCAQLIGESDAFFGMAFERHGSAIALERDPALVRAEVTFFEAELLEACFRSLPCLVVHARETPPSASMQEFLRLVSSTLGEQLAQVERISIPHHFDEFCRSLHDVRERPSPWLFDPLSLGRLWQARKREARDPRLGFLGDAFRSDGRGDADEAVIRAALNRVEQSIDLNGQPLGHIGRLSYLWMAVRELAKTSMRVRAHDLNDVFQRTLMLWNGSAAWHGLHGSHPMGCLATLNELGHARLVAGEDDPPNHPRASAYYSIGARARARPIARRFFGQSFDLCQAGLQRRDSNRVALLQQRASAEARLALLGEPWRYFDALRDYKFAFDARAKGDYPSHQVGEAQSEYAFALFKLPFRRAEALELARESLDLMRTESSAGGIGFFCRGARKYSEMLMAAGMLDEARRVATEARTVADAVQAFDQSRQLAGLFAEIERRAS